MTNEKGLSPLFVMEKEIKKCEKFDKSIASDGRNVTSGEKRKLRSEKPRARERTEKTQKLQCVMISDNVKMQPEL